MNWSLISPQSGKRAETGSMMLMFAFVILPFLFFIFSSALDLNGYFLAKERAKRFVDESSMRAWKFLPNQTLAIKAIAESAALYGIESADYSASVLNGDVTVSYEKSFPLWFSRYFNDAAQLPVQTYAIATGTPFETSILLDTSSYLAPSSGAAWGNLSEWGAARFFTVHPELGAGAPATPLEHTQHCFNPVFSAMKRAAIDLHEFLSSFGRNAVGLGYFPANGLEVEELRPLSKGGPMRFSNTASPQGEVRFISNSTSSVNFPSWCAAAANSETSFDGYRFPDAQANRVFHPTPTAESIVMPVGFSFNSAYSESLAVRESLWSATVSDRNQNTSEVISQGVGSLLQGGGVSNGGLTGREVKTLLILSGGFPRDSSGTETNIPLANSVGKIAAIILDEKDIDLRIFYVVVYSADVFPSKSSFDNHFEALSAEVNAALQTVYQNDQSDPKELRLARRFDFQAVRADNASNALNDVAGQLMLVRRNSLLAQ